MAVRPRIAWFLCFLLASSSSAFSLSGSLSPSSQVSQGALCLLRYDGSGRVHRGPSDVLVSSSLSPWRHELQLILRMRRLSVLRLEAYMRQEAARLALCV